MKYIENIQYSLMQELHSPLAPIGVEPKCNTSVLAKFNTLREATEFFNALTEFVYKYKNEEMS